MANLVNNVNVKTQMGTFGEYPQPFARQLSYEIIKLALLYALWGLFIEGGETRVISNEHHIVAQSLLMIMENFAYNFARGIYQHQAFAEVTEMKTIIGLMQENFIIYYPSEENMSIYIMGRFWRLKNYSLDSCNPKLFNPFSSIIANHIFHSRIGKMDRKSQVLKDASIFLRTMVGNIDMTNLYGTIILCYISDMSDGVHFLCPNCNTHVRELLSS